VRCMSSYFRIERLVFISDGDDGLTLLDVAIDPTSCKDPIQAQSYVGEVFSDEFYSFPTDEPPGVYLWKGEVLGSWDYWGEYDEDWSGDWRLLRELTDKERKLYYGDWELTNG
jgi:hypothetical protein